VNLLTASTIAKNDVRHVLYMRYLLYIVRHSYLRFADLMRFARVGKALNGNALALALELAPSNYLLTSKVPKVSLSFD
jgi:hypothetical protein